MSHPFLGGGGARVASGGFTKTLKKGGTEILEK